MKKTFKNGTQVVVFPGAIVVYNFSGADAAEVSQVESANPGAATVFVATKFDRTVFSQAENTTRTFIFLRGAVDEAAVDPTYPAQWVSPGDFIPAVPGNVSVEATATGFKVTSFSADPAETAEF